MEMEVHNQAIVVPPSRKLPFETWRPIFQDVYATENAISHPPSDFVFSPLHSRLNVYRNLALVSKSWRENARDVFFEELDAYTADSLKGIIQTFQREKMLPSVVSRIKFSFWEFRCSASQPRRPRTLRPEPAGSSTTAVVQDWKRIHRKDSQLYVPSTTGQGSHWRRWQADTAHILSMCTSLSTVSIVFTNEQHSFALWGYRAFFAPPDLSNENIFSGLMCSPNLRKLHLVDPAPLEHYGPSLARLTRLTNIVIKLTTSTKELQNTALSPPKSLKSLSFQDHSNGEVPWPLASDLARCTDLQILDLRLPYRVHSQTIQAVAFLCTAYQHSLRQLKLHMKLGHELAPSFQSLLTSFSSPLHFLKLEYLCLTGSTVPISTFSGFQAEMLTRVEVYSLDPEETDGTKEDAWRGLGYPSLAKLKQLILQIPSDQEGRESLCSVCERLGIQLVTQSAQNKEPDEDSY